MKGFKNTIRKKPYLRWILAVSNWFFQGIAYADILEKIYKLSFTVVFSVIFSLSLFSFQSFSGLHSIILGVFIAHTLNWLINSNLYSVVIHRLQISKLDKKDAFTYLEKLSRRIENRKGILYITVHGSICMGKLKPTSDIDIAVVRQKGFKNAIHSLWFYIYEQKLADYSKIPLEIYLCDSPENAIERFRNEKTPIVIYDPFKIVDSYYHSQLSIAEAKVLNGL
jgi:predicted nucleotidyltransferase